MELHYPVNSRHEQEKLILHQLISAVSIPDQHGS